MIKLLDNKGPMPFYAFDGRGFGKLEIKIPLPSILKKDKEAF